MTLRDDLLEQADARRVRPANSIVKITPSIRVRALYHAGATNATLSPKCATFVSLRVTRTIDFVSGVCCTHGILLR
jgi:hypothetical protein